MKYQITDSNYQIDKFLGNKSEEEKTITITSDMDGTEIQREQYINVKQK